MAAAAEKIRLSANQTTTQGRHHVKRIIGLSRVLLVIALFLGGWAALILAIVSALRFQGLSALGCFALSVVCFASDVVLLGAPARRSTKPGEEELASAPSGWVR